jgi:hypothetical protein
MSEWTSPRATEFKPCANPGKRAKTLQFLAAQCVVADLPQRAIFAFAQKGGNRSNNTRARWNRCAATIINDAQPRAGTSSPCRELDAATAGRGFTLPASTLGCWPRTKK